jgi:rfaE bifunctional protein nucleotidyltransferase chain/domain
MKKIFVNGTFDILHLGHLALFNYAKSLGDFLHVGIDSDARIAQLKGPGRPINSAHERKVMLENLKAIDQVSVFGSEVELIALIRGYAPDVMLVGSDYQNKRVIGAEFASKLEFFSRIEEFSSTKKIEVIHSKAAIVKPVGI